MTCIPYQKLRKLAILSFQNALRLHFDSLILYKIGSYPSSVLLSILSMEEFGKYFSLSRYVFYNTVNRNKRSKEMEQEYLSLLYSHPYKQKVFFGEIPLQGTMELWHRANSREFEKLKQTSIYVGFERVNGKILSNKPYYNPLKIGMKKARTQVNFLNNLIIKLVKQRINGNIMFDEDEINDILSQELLKELKL